MRFTGLLDGLSDRTPPRFSIVRTIGIGVAYPPAAARADFLGNLVITPGNLEQQANRLAVWFGFEDLRTKMGVQSSQFEPRAGQRAADGLSGFAILNVQAKFTVGMRGFDVWVGVDIQIGCDAQPDAGGGSVFGSQGFQKCQLRQAV